jgi:hypothetical protein
MEVPESHRGRLQLVILAGQSNMVGLAPLPEELDSDPRVFVFGNDYRWRLAQEPVDDGRGQVDEVSRDRGGFGPSMAFAMESVRRDPSLLIGLIPCAKGASSIAEWQRNPSDQSLYGSCLKRARAASPMGPMRGMLFFQGETDAQVAIRPPRPGPNSENWADLFTTFVADLRRDLGVADLPVVYAQLGPPGPAQAFPRWEVVKAQQSRALGPGMAMIVTDDLPLFDELHFSVAGYRQIGVRFAEAFWSIPGPGAR